MPIFNLEECLQGIRSGKSNGLDLSVFQKKTGDWQTKSFLTGHPDGVISFVVLPNGQLASGSYDGTIKLWNVATGECASTLKADSDRVVGLAALPTGQLASASCGGTIRLWNIATGRCELTLEGGADSYYTLALVVLPNGQLASGSWYCDTIKLWNVETGRCELTLKAHLNGVFSLAVLPTGQLASASEENWDIQLWNVATGRLESTLTGHSGGVHDIVVLATGQLASASQDKTIKLWNVVTGRCELTLTGHGHGVIGLGVLTTGQLVSVSYDKTIKLWNVETGRCELTFPLTGNDLSLPLTLMGLPNGRWASGHRDGTIKLWNPQEVALTYADIVPVLDELIQHPSALEHLSLKGIALNPKAYERLTQVVESNPTLLSLDVTQTGLTPAQTQRLQDCLLLPSLLTQGFAHIQSGQPAEAITDFTKVLAVNPNHSEAFLNRGFAYAALGQHELAIEDYTEVLRLVPNHAKAAGALKQVQSRLFETQAKIQYQAQNYVQAILMCVQGLGVDANHSALVKLKGLCHYQRGQYAEAQLQFTRCAVLEPHGNGVVWGALTRWKQNPSQVGAMKLSLQEANAVINKNPLQAAGYLVRALLMMALNEGDKAALEKAEMDFILFHEKIAAPELSGVDEEERFILMPLCEAGQATLAEQQKQRTPLAPSVPVKGLAPLQKDKVEAKVVYPYDAGEEDQLTVKKGSWVEVMEEYATGWWLCRQGDREGFVPKDYLQKGVRVSSYATPAPLPPQTQPARGKVSAPEEGIYSDALLSQHWSIDAGDLQFLEKVGGGGCGIVYRAKWKEVTVAVKQLRGSLNERAIAELVSEARVMSDLQHPHIVHLFGITHQEPFCLVMEWMGKGSFDRVLKKESLSFEQRVKIMKQVAKGLSFLHSKNIVHRDLKSLNVLIDKHGSAKLADFGLSVVKQTTRSTLTADDGYVGTLPWKAPELLNIRGKHSKESDVYSLGMVLWEAVSGKLPYEDVEDEEEIRAHVRGGGREEIPETTPRWYQSLIERCWSGNPSARPSAAEVVEALKQGLKHGAGVAPSQAHQSAKASMPGNKPPLPSAPVGSGYINLRAQGNPPPQPSNRLNPQGNPRGDASKVAFFQQIPSPLEGGGYVPPKPSAAPPKPLPKPLFQEGKKPSRGNYGPG